MAGKTPAQVRDEASALILDFCNALRDKGYTPDEIISGLEMTKDVMVEEGEGDKADRDAEDAEGGED